MNLYDYYVTHMLLTCDIKQISEYQCIVVSNKIPTMTSLLNIASKEPSPTS